MTYLLIPVALLALSCALDAIGWWVDPQPEKGDSP
jgi:hypothetical protein